MVDIGVLVFRGRVGVFFCEFIDEIFVWFYYRRVYIWVESLDNFLYKIVLYNGGVGFVEDFL